MKYKILSKCRKIIVISVLLFIIITGTVFCLFHFGFILFNNPSADKYPVRGVDVSAYQGEINWEVLSQENIQFAYIKATEGSSHTDRYFKYNLENALKTDLRVGAYHFFSFDSGGDTQADNFISAVPKRDDMLPPVVDFEFYGDKEKKPPDRELARQELSVLLNRLTEHYEKKPVIYVTGKSYALYISGFFAEYDIWFRSVFNFPKIPDGGKWSFWQYTDRERLKGYNGQEKYIDMNVFHGSTEEFLKYGD